MLSYQIDNTTTTQKICLHRYIQESTPDDTAYARTHLLKPGHMITVGWRHEPQFLISWGKYLNDLISLSWEGTRGTTKGTLDCGTGFLRSLFRWKWSTSAPAILAMEYFGTNALATNGLDRLNCQALYVSYTKVLSD